MTDDRHARGRDAPARPRRRRQRRRRRRSTSRGRPTRPGRRLLRPGPGGHTDNPSGLLRHAPRPPVRPAAAPRPPRAGGRERRGRVAPGAAARSSFAGSGAPRVTLPLRQRATVRPARLVDEHGRADPQRDRRRRDSVAALRGAAPVAGQPAVTGADGGVPLHASSGQSRARARCASRTATSAPGDVVADGLARPCTCRAGVRLGGQAHAASSVRYCGRVLSGRDAAARASSSILQGRVRGGRVADVRQPPAARRARACSAADLPAEGPPPRSRASSSAPAPSPSPAGRTSRRPAGS